MNTPLNNLIVYVQSKEIEQGLDLSKLEMLVDAVKNARALQSVPVEDLRAELKARGYFTDNLWQIDDVQTVIDNYNYENAAEIELSDADKYQLLDDVLAGDGVISDVNIQLSFAFEAYLEDNIKYQP